MQHLLTGFPLPTSPGMSWIITLALECPGKLQLSWKMGKQDQIMISGSDNPADKYQSFVVRGLGKQDQIMISGSYNPADKYQSFVVRGLGKQDQIMISGSDNPGDKCQSFVVRGLGKQDQIMIFWNVLENYNCPEKWKKTGSNYD